MADEEFPSMPLPPAGRVIGACQICGARILIEYHDVNGVSVPVPTPSCQCMSIASWSKLKI